MDMIVDMIQDMKLDLRKGIQNFVLKEIQTTCFEYKIVSHAPFIDFWQAYDRINSQQLSKASRHQKN